VAKSTTTKKASVAKKTTSAKKPIAKKPVAKKPVAKKPVAKKAIAARKPVNTIGVDREALLKKLVKLSNSKVDTVALDATKTLLTYIK
jgi:histone H1/5